MNGSLELLLRELKLPAFLAQAQPLAIEAERSSWSFTRYLHTLADSPDARPSDAGKNNQLQII